MQQKPWLSVVAQMREAHGYVTLFEYTKKGYTMQGKTKNKLRNLTFLEPGGHEDIDQWPFQLDLCSERDRPRQDMCGTILHDQP